MELTQSAFNVLLDMTSLRDLVEEETRAIAERVKPAERAEPVKPASDAALNKSKARVIHYSDGASREQLSGDQLIERILNTPRATHWVWVPQERSWRRWSDVPSVLSAARARRHPTSPQPAPTASLARAERAQATAPKRVETSQADTSQADTPQAETSEAERSINPLAALERPYVQPTQPEYTSVPETDFTRFTLELTDPAQITPYIGDQGTLESGGLVIHTPRVFRVGDEIQIKATISGEELISFEAPIKWVESSEDPRDLFGGGVVVEWPALSGAQRREVEGALGGVEALFYG